MSLGIRTSNMLPSQGVKALKKFVKDHMFAHILVVVCGFLFFYHLDYSTLVSFDEAWYASIAHTMIQTGDWMNMKWLSEPFFDHPPLGMWLMAVSYGIFGVGEFAARFPSALLGIGTILLIYLTANEMFKKKIIGFAAALALGSGVWFVARARSGNLDTIFTFFYMASVYTSLRAYKNPKWFIAAGISFGALIMTKTLVGISALPLMLYVSFPQWLKPKNALYIVAAIVIWSIIVLPWYTTHRALYPEFDHHHFTNIGTRNRTVDSYFNFAPAKQVLFFLHMGIRKWYKIWLVSGAWLVGRFFFVKEHRRNILFLLLWNVGILFPFLSSELAQLWHLIPVYLPVVLTIGYALYDGLQFVQTFVGRYIPGVQKNNLLNKIYLAGFIVIVFLQIRTFWPELIPQYRYTADNVKIAREAGRYNKTLYVDGDFQQMAVFYSGQDVTRVRDASSNDPEYKNTLVGLFRTDEEDFLVITSWWAPGKLDDLDIEYQVVERINDFVLVGRPGEYEK